MLIKKEYEYNFNFPGNERQDSCSDIATCCYLQHLRRVASVPDNLSWQPHPSEPRLRSYSMPDKPAYISVASRQKREQSVCITISSRFSPPTAESFTILMPEPAAKTQGWKIDHPLNFTTQQISLALQRHGKNIGAVLGRNLFSVAIPTALRELFAKALLPSLTGHRHGVAHVAMGSIAIAIPIALQLLGIARDIHGGTQTRATLSARLANIALITGAGSALVACGGVAAAANALIAAVFIYVPLRDITQYFMQLTDNSSPEINFNGCAKSAIAYTGNQILVSECMDMLAEALQPLLGKVAANMLGKAMVNLAGETVDEISFRGFKAQETHNPAVELHLGLRPPAMINYQTATDQVLNTIASRTSLFAAAFSAVYALPVRGVASSMLIGVILGAAYLPFIYCHAQHPARDVIDNMETGGLPAT